MNNPISPEQREEIQKEIKEFKNITRKLSEGINTETCALLISRNELKGRFAEHIDTLLSSEQAWKNEAEQLRKRLERSIETSVDISELNRVKKELKRIAVGSTDGESRFIAGQCLSSLSQENRNRCIKCNKDFEHDLYSCWCNECGEYAEKEVRERTEETK